MSHATTSVIASRRRISEQYGLFIQSSQLGQHFLEEVFYELFDLEGIQNTLLENIFLVKWGQMIWDKDLNFLFFHNNRDISNIIYILW